jgi:hypothetical protein
MKIAVIRNTTAGRSCLRGAIMVEMDLGGCVKIFFAMKGNETIALF